MHTDRAWRWAGCIASLLVVLGVVVAATFAVSLAACGEKPTASVYQQGKYSGRQDTEPWQNERFKGNQVEWEKAVKARNNGQNEYVRIGQ